MSSINNILPEDALALAEAERMRIRTWDLQRRQRAAPDSETVTDQQAEQSAALLDELSMHLSKDERQDIVQLVSTVRTRLDLKGEQG